MKVLMIGTNFSNKNLDSYEFKNLKVEIDYAEFSKLLNIEKNLNLYNLYFIEINSSDSKWIYLVKLIRTFSQKPIVIAIDNIHINIQLTALDLNVTWFILKPFSSDFLARIIKKFLWDYNICYQINTLFFYKENRNLLIDNTKISLTNKEYLLLEFLIENKNTVLSRNQILDKIWGLGNGNLRLLDFHVKNLRKKLNIYSSYLVTLNGLGYSWRENNIN